MEINLKSLEKFLKPIFFLILFGCLILSTIQTAEGYQKIFSFEKSLVIAIIASLGLLVINIILSGTDNPERIKNLMIIYCAIGIFSFTGNFNAFFSNFVQKEYIKDQITLLEQDVESQRTFCVNSLREANEFSSTEIEVMKLFTTLKYEILNSGNEGIGRKAKNIIRKIEELLEVKLTILSDVDPTVLVEKMESQIEDLLSDSEKKVEPVNSLISEINGEVDLALKDLADSKNNDSNKKQAFSAVANGVRVFNSVCVKTKEFLAQYLTNTKNIECSTKTLDVDQIGTINHSFETAIKFGYPFASIFSFFASLFVDFFPPILLLAFKKRQKPKDPKSVKADIKHLDEKQKKLDDSIKEIEGKLKKL